MGAGKGPVFPARTESALSPIISLASQLSEHTQDICNPSINQVLGYSRFSKSIKRFFFLSCGHCY